MQESLWFPDFDLLVPQPDALPNDAISAAKALGIWTDRAYVLLHAHWRKFDDAHRTKVGLAGDSCR